MSKNTVIKMLVEKKAAINQLSIFTYVPKVRYSDYESSKTKDTSSNSGSELSTDTSSCLILKKVKKKTKKLAQAEINNKSKETRHQRTSSTITNSKKQWVNKENHPPKK